MRARYLTEDADALDRILLHYMKPGECVWGDQRASRGYAGGSPHPPAFHLANARATRDVHDVCVRKPSSCRPRGIGLYGVIELLILLCRLAVG